MFLSWFLYLKNKIVIHYLVLIIRKIHSFYIFGIVESSICIFISEWPNRIISCDLVIRYIERSLYSQCWTKMNKLILLDVVFLVLRFIRIDNCVYIVEIKSGISFESRHNRTRVIGSTPSRRCPRNAFSNNNVHRYLFTTKLTPKNINIWSYLRTQPLR